MSKNAKNFLSLGIGLLMALGFVLAIFFLKPETDPQKAQDWATRVTTAMTKK